jgi:hypothetical protein
MKQIELTSKFVLAIIGLTLVGVILAPTYAASTTVPNNNTTSFDDIVNGQNIPSQEDIRNLVSEAIQLKVVAISSPIADIQPNSGRQFTVECPAGMFATGGGFSTVGTPLDVIQFQPWLSGNVIQSGDTPDEWRAIITNPTEATISTNVWVVCIGLGQ